MSAIRILHVDDEADIREVVDLSLALDPDFELRAYASGPGAIAAAAEWLPFVILLDVVMPGMDGPATLAQLHRNPQSADIAVLFMTARAQSREIEQLIALGAQGVISKPFDPMRLAALVRSHVQTVRTSTLRAIFARRARGDASRLQQYRSRLAEHSDAGAIEALQQFARNLADAAALVGFDQIGGAARAVEQAAANQGDGTGATGDLAVMLERLTLGLDNEWQAPAAAVA